MTQAELRARQKREALRITQNELKYNSRLRQLFARIIKTMEPAQDPMEIVSILRALERSPEFKAECASAARSMATAMSLADLQTWRQAAEVSTRGREIYLALKRETASNTEIGQTIEGIIQENAKLIRTVPQDIAEKFTETIRQRQMSGLRPDAILEELQQRAPMLTKEQARRIARTESGKAATALREARARKYHRDFYIWFTSHDERVRDSHRLMHNVICRWDDPPNPEMIAGEARNYGSYHPRGIFNCRCDALSIVALEDITFPHKCHSHGQIVTIKNLGAFRNFYGVAA